MLLPLALLAVATFAAALVAYGNHPAWAQHSYGLSLIICSRTWQWPLTALSIALCLSVVGLVVAGRRRAWWLIGLGPVLALFVHRFHSDPLLALRILDSPPATTPAQASFLTDNDWVVGTRLGDAHYAFPYAQLYRSPVIVQPEHDKRLLLLWSAFANRALAYEISRELRAADLEIVSMPANALLVYNRKLGQFINGVSGRTGRGEQPAGFVQQLPTHKMTWAQWKMLHPETKVMAPPSPSAPRTPDRPLLPYYPMPGTDPALPPLTRIAMISTTPPLALPEEAIRGEPLNLSGDFGAVLVFRDTLGRVRAFDRRVGDLTLHFKPAAASRRRPPAMFVDADTNSSWNSDGRALEGDLARVGRRLKVLPVDEQLYWSVMKAHIPDLVLVRP